MAAQYLSDPTAQQSVMNSLFTAFAGFTAFGVAIVAVLAGGGAVQKMADRWGSREERRHPDDHWCWLLEPLMIGSVTVLICLVVLGSGTGLMLSFLWLHAAGSGGWSWAYGVSVGLFESEVGAMTVVTFVAVVAAASTSAAKAKETKKEQSADNTATRQPAPGDGPRRRYLGSDPYFPRVPISELAPHAAGIGQHRARSGLRLAPAVPADNRLHRAAGPGAGQPTKGSRPRQRGNCQITSKASCRLPPKITGSQQDGRRDYQRWPGNRARLTGIVVCDCGGDCCAGWPCVVVPQADPLRAPRRCWRAPGTVALHPC